MNEKEFEEWMALRQAKDKWIEYIKQCSNQGLEHLKWVFLNHFKGAKNFEELFKEIIMESHLRWRKVKTTESIQLSSRQHNFS